MKKSFVVYLDWQDMFNELPDEDAGKLIKHIFSYVNGDDKKSESILINALFANIKNSINRDAEKWETQLEQRKQAGMLSAKSRATKVNERSTKVNERSTKSNEIQRALTSVDERERNPTVSVNVSDTVSVIKENDLSVDKINWDSFLTFFNKTFNKKSKGVSPEIKKKYEARIKSGFTKDDLVSAMVNASKDPYHLETKFKHCTLEFFSRHDKLDKFASISPFNDVKNHKPPRPTIDTKNARDAMHVALYMADLVRRGWTEEEIRLVSIGEHDGVGGYDY